jgi:hypothetical protein
MSRPVFGRLFDFPGKTSGCRAGTTNEVAAFRGA